MWLFSLLMSDRWGGSVTLKYDLLKVGVYSFTVLLTR